MALEFPTSVKIPNLRDSISNRSLMKTDRVTFRSFLALLVLTKPEMSGHISGVTHIELSIIDFSGVER